WLIGLRSVRGAGLRWTVSLPYLVSWQDWTPLVVLLGKGPFWFNLPFFRPFSSRLKTATFSSWSRRFIAKMIGPTLSTRTRSVPALHRIHGCSFCVIRTIQWVALSGGMNSSAWRKYAYGPTS